MKALLLLGILLTAIVAASIFVHRGWLQPQQVEVKQGKHIYATWDTMEFDKCVAAWLIVHFIDKDAKFVFYPSESEIREGILFDVPGADWSRKHLKCTSQCILETIKQPDQAMEEIVSIAAKTELNFWQLDRWPQAQRCFYEVKEIMDQNPDMEECFRKTHVYFDELYRKFKENNVAAREI